MALVVLGSSGNLGSALISFLSERLSENIYCLDSQSPQSSLDRPNIHYLKCDFLSSGFSDEFIHELINKKEKITFVNLIAKDYPVLDSLHASAFIGSPFDLPVSDIAESYSVTLGSSYKLIQEIQKLGDTPYHVILVGSIYGISLPRHNIYNHPDDNSPMLFKPVAYSLAKAAQILLLKEAVRCFGAIKKRFNMISFGGIDLNQDEGFKTRYKEITPNSDLVSLSEVCDMFLFMINDSPDSMNGSNVLVDGGWTSAN